MISGTAVCFPLLYCIQPVYEIYRVCESQNAALGAALVPLQPTVPTEAWLRVFSSL